MVMVNLMFLVSNAVVSIVSIISKSLTPELQQRHLKSCNLLFDFFKST